MGRAEESVGGRVGAAGGGGGGGGGAAAAVVTNLFPCVRACVRACVRLRAYVHMRARLCACVCV